MAGMIHISDSAQQHFRRLLDTQGGDAAGILVTAIDPGTPRADCRLTFCDADELIGGEWAVECDGFTLYIAQGSAEFLDQAEVDYVREGATAQLTIRAPRLKGTPPEAGASLPERLRWVIDSEINPQLASHGGHVALESVEADGSVRLRFGGGCHGCGMADVTLKQGIEKTLRARFPEITAVRDATDHATGANPYIPR